MSDPNTPGSNPDDNPYAPPSFEKPPRPAEGQPPPAPPYGQQPPPYGQPPGQPGWGPPPGAPPGQPPPYGQPHYGQPPPYGAPYGQPGYPPPGYGTPPPAGKPDNYLVWAVLSTLLCCLPLGVASIVFASQVNSKWAAGDFHGAVQSSEKAKRFAIFSAGAGVILGVIFFSIGAFGSGGNGL